MGKSGYSQLKGRPLNEIKTRREAESKPIVEAIKIKLDSLLLTLPESSLGKAIRYTLSLWPGLNVFLQNPAVPMDTNGIERTLRGPVVGRKNYAGSKNLKSAEVAAIWFSVIETCKANGLEPNDYILQTIRRILQKNRSSCLGTGQNLQTDEVTFSTVPKTSPLFQCQKDGLQ